MNRRLRNTVTGQLIQPSVLLPWSIEVVSAIPKTIMSLHEGDEPKKKKKRMASGVDGSQINAGSVCPGWACLASWKGHVYVWLITTTNGSASSSVKPIIGAPKTCVTLFHPSLVSPSNDSSPPLIALAPASPDAIYVYACNPAIGGLVVWKVSRDDVRVPMTRPLAYAHTMLPLDRKEVEEDDNEDSGELAELAASLTVVDRHRVVVGTSVGGLISCTQSSIPLALHAQRMLKVKPSRRSLMVRIFGSNSSEHVGAPEDDSPIIFALPLPSFKEESTELLAVSLWGCIWHWKIKETVATSHRVTTQAFCLTTIASLFLQSLPNMNLTHVEVLQAKLLGNRVHILVRTKQDSDCQLFWVLLNWERKGSEISLNWTTCQWLNRFPAAQDVEAMGLALTGNGMAYAAFHQGSGGVTSSVIVMAASADSNDGDANDAAMTVHEVDLPITEIPALLPGTFVNDVVTHGVCMFARSGLGIRARVLPPATTTLSLHAAKHANAAAVVKLTSHLRSAFWQAYHQGATSGGSLALPPSFAEASPVDLEEAAIAVANQIHMQRCSDATGWSLVSSGLQANALGFHIAFISWLRQGGIYRSLSTYGKWRLVAFGQEVAAFMDLHSISPSSTPWEQEQISSLSLAKVASWLKQTLEATLRDGDIDQYQLWCGWFSTALATSMMYRNERASATYDITAVDSPPKIGSKNAENDGQPETHRVPVWTSHPVLQKTFGILLQHWKACPKQRSIHDLPPQTVEVIARAALISFADSASSLSSERATGTYSEIKAVVIPLLRTLHPPMNSRADTHSDDELAFQLAVRHEYYEGICRMALDHEDKPDADNFRLGPLLKSPGKCQSIDYSTGFTFGQFVLQWHTDRGLFGHAILYGRLCPERDLNHILQSDDRLRSYRWIQHVHKGDYNGAAAALIATGNTLEQTKWTFCMAKLSNHVVLNESPLQLAQAEKREERINNTLELVGVQKELLGRSLGLCKSRTEQHLWSANRLLSRAMEESVQGGLQGSKNQAENATRSCYLGLLVCTTFEDKAVQRRQAVQVWAKAIALDLETHWTEWSRTDEMGQDGLAREVLDNTVFGGLLQECVDDVTLSNVTFSESMEHEIFQELGLIGDPGVNSLRRLLSTVKTLVKTYAGVETMIDAHQSETASVVY